MHVTFVFATTQRARIANYCAVATRKYTISESAIVTARETTRTMTTSAAASIGIFSIVHVDVVTIARDEFFAIRATIAPSTRFETSKTRTIKYATSPEELHSSFFFFKAF